MDKIDIKLFKNQSKFKVVLNKLVKQKDILEDKEIYFNNLSVEDAENLNSSTDNIAESIYNLIPVLTNIDMTINVKEFEEMYNNPTTVFEDFLMNFIEHIQSLLEIKSKIFKTANKMDELFKNNGIDLKKLKELQMQEKENKKAEIKNEIEELYEKMKDDKEHRAEILEQINKLEEKLNNKDKGDINE
ncbi:hypothetical protein [Haloimpatiens massiliensis]|uniref:hypothetical protein n=1 Tax=Haloimpatiens massiliensis TaxID=1658110 RepID=UPI000C836848|nr:hypothetical protein [Haloimpatiens massiliensis]